MATSEEPPDYDPRFWEQRYRPKNDFTRAEWRTMEMSLYVNLATIFVVGAAVWVARQMPLWATLAYLLVPFAVMMSMSTRRAERWRRKDPGNMELSRQAVQMLNVLCAIGGLALLGHAVGLGK